MNLYASVHIQLDRFILFINPRAINYIPNRKLEKFIAGQHGGRDKRHSTICDPEVQYFGWKVTAIILIIVTIGSLILVISLSVTMPYNVWDKPKIQRLPVRLTDEIIRAN